MEKNKKYNIENFFVGELYLYTNFANFISDSYDPQTKNQVINFLQSGAINFQTDMESRYIDWDSGREYTGFLTIFYKKGNRYLCLHNGISYELNGSNFIENLIPLNEILPKINAEIMPSITIDRALQLFDILFKETKEDIKLYSERKEALSDFYVGDIILKEFYHQRSFPESRYQYINLPIHTMLNKYNLAIQTFTKEDYQNVIYRCLFLKQDLDLYNIHDHQFYNHNEDSFQSIINFQEYLKKLEIEISQETISIPKALKLFKNTI